MIEAVSLRGGEVDAARPPVGEIFGASPYITATFASVEMGLGGLGRGGVFVFARGCAELDAREDWLKGGKGDLVIKNT